MPRPVGYRNNPVKGRDAMSYKDHIKKGFERGTINGGYKESDFFQKDGTLKKKQVSKYDK